MSKYSKNQFYSSYASSNAFSLLLLPRALFARPRNGGFGITPLRAAAMR
jgi:hypothetical protein